MSRALPILGLCVSGLVLAAAPFVLAPFLVYQLSMAIIYAIAILGLVLLTGGCGLVSLGQSTFMAVGAYSGALLMESGWPLIATLPAAAVLGLAVGSLFAWPAVRLRPESLALATFALAMATPQVLRWGPLEAALGGSGIPITRGADPPGWLPLGPDQWLYLVTAVIGGVLLFGSWTLRRSHFGRAMAAVRDQPIAAAALGIPVTRVRIAAFAISAACAAIAGALLAAVVGFIAPDTFGPALAIALFVGAITGGVASLLAAPLGGLFVLYVPNLAADISLEAAGFVYGALLLLTVIVFPGGIASLVIRLGGAIRRMTLATDAGPIGPARGDEDNPPDLKPGGRFPVS